MKTHFDVDRLEENLGLNPAKVESTQMEKKTSRPRRHLHAILIQIVKEVCR